MSFWKKLFSGKKESIEVSTSDDNFGSNVNEVGSSLSNNNEEDTWDGHNAVENQKLILGETILIGNNDVFPLILVQITKI